MKIRILPIALLFVLAACQQQTPVADYPDADAVILNLEKSFTLNEDGSLEEQVNQSIKLQSYRAFHNLYGQTDIYYNPEFDSIVVHRAETEMADGKIVSVPDNGYVDMLPSYAVGAAQFSNLKHKAIVHTALEREAVIHSSYTKYTKPGAQPTLMGHETLTQSIPVGHYTLVVKVPKGTALKHLSHLVAVSPKKTRKGKFDVYTWKLDNIEAIGMESNGPTHGSNRKQILFGAADSLFPLFNDFTSQRAFTFETSIAMRERASDAVFGKENTFEKIAALHEIVATEITSHEVPLSQTGYKIKPAIETWERMSGTREEKAVLLCALIRSTGWKATPVALIPNYLLPQDSTQSLIGNLDLMKFHLVRFPMAGEFYYLNPDRFNLIDPIFTYPDHTIVPLEMGYSHVNLMGNKVEEIQLSWDASYSINNADQLVGKIDANYMGAVNPYLGLKMKPAAVNEIYSGTGTVERLLKDQSLVSFAVALNDHVYTIGNKFKVILPYSQDGFGSLGINNLSKTRKEDLVLPAPLREFQRIKIELPRGYSSFDQLLDFSHQNDLGRVSIRHTQDAANFYATRTLLIQKRIIAPEEYPLFIELLQTYLDPKWKEVYFH